MATTLLTDAFSQAILYWRVNAGGTRAGLIAHLQSSVGISAGTAARWVDAITAECFNIAMTDDTTYAAFKARIIAVGVTRAQAGVTCAFERLREGTLVLDARDEKLVQVDEIIAELNTKITTTTATIAAVTATPASENRSTELIALNLYLKRLNSMLTTRQDERASLVAQG